MDREANRLSAAGRQSEPGVPFPAPGRNAGANMAPSTIYFLQGKNSITEWCSFGLRYDSKKPKQLDITRAKRPQALPGALTHRYPPSTQAEPRALLRPMRYGQLLDMFVTSKLKAVYLQPKSLRTCRVRLGTCSGHTA